MAKPLGNSFENPGEIAPKNTWKKIKLGKEQFRKIDR